MLYFLTQYTITCALKSISAQLVASLYYVTVIYAAVISFFVWHVVPGSMAMLGILLVIGGGVLCILSERRQTESVQKKEEELKKNMQERLEAQRLFTRWKKLKI